MKYIFCRVFNKAQSSADQNKQGLKRMLFNKTIQYNIHISKKILFQVSHKTDEDYRNKYESYLS